jgi:hypothetical protein
LFAAAWMRKVRNGYRILDGNLSKSSHLEDVEESDIKINRRETGCENQNLTELLKIINNDRLCYSRAVQSSGYLTREFIFSQH